jgi:uncharacterized membrane protein
VERNLATRNFYYVGVKISAVLVVSAIYLIKKIKEPAMYNWQNSVIFLFIFLVLFIIIYLMTNKFNQKRVQKYEKEFDDDNNL